MSRAGFHSPAWARAAGQFGPFSGQLSVGEQAQSTVMRVMLERIEGAIHGACVAFRRGFHCGVNCLQFGLDSRRARQREP